MRNTLRSLLALSLFAGIAAQAAPSNIDVVKSFMTEIVNLSVDAKNTQGATNEESKKKIVQISQKIDFIQLAKRSFGARWSKFKESDRKDFIATFEQLLEVTVYPRAQKINAKGDSIKYAAMPGKSSVVQVKGQIEQERKGDIVQQDIELQLHVDPKTSKIIDVVIEGELLSKNLKRQFDEALKKKTFGEIISQMKKRVDESKKAN